MKPDYVPEYYSTLSPYLIVKDADKLLRLLQDVFGAVLKNNPERNEEGHIRHAELAISEVTVMVAEVSEKCPINSSMMYIYVENVDSVYQKALSLGMESISEPALSSHCKDRMAAVKDHSGNQWWIGQRV